MSALINDLYRTGDYEAALSKITHNKLNIENLNNEIFEYQLIKSEILADQEKFDESLSFTSEIYQLAKTYDFGIYQFKCLLQLSKLHFAQYNVQMAKDSLAQAEHLLSQYKQELTTDLHYEYLSKYYRIKGRLLQFDGAHDDALVEYEKSREVAQDHNDDFDLSHAFNSIGTYYLDKADFLEALTLFEKALTIREQYENKYLVINSLNNIGLAYLNQGELDKSLAQYERSLVLTKQYQLKETTSNLYNNIGLIYQYQGDLGTSVYYHNLSMEINQEIDSKINLSISYNNLGLIYLMQGDLNNALDYQLKGLKIAEETNDELKIAGSYNNIGLIYQQKGELHRALIYHYRHLKNSEKHDLKQDMATAFVNIGSIYQIQGKYENAKENFLKTLGLDQAIGNDIDISESLYNMIILELENAKIEFAREYLDQLENINDKTQNKIIDLRYRLAEAIFNKRLGRTINRAKSQELLQTIAHEDLIDHELTVYAKLNLCDLLLTELKNTSDEDVLGEINFLVDDLVKIAEKQQSYRLLGEIYLLKSKLALLQLDIDLAKEMLKKASEVVFDKGLTNLSLKISNQHDILLDQEDKLESFIRNNASLKDRLEEIRLDELVTNLINRRPEEEQREPETPELLLILNKGGIPLYRKIFSTAFEVKNELLGGFISALHSMSEDIFKSKNATQRIRHDDFIVIIQPDDQLLFSYVFMGQSYQAQTKLEDYINRIRDSSTIWSALNRKVSGLTKSEKDGMDILTDDIFNVNNYA
ncbi:MAG: tetratricopeptide repeat protein [Candidatus Heimdallarchaeota archaeon]|nr:tetratricopeptide repeat protein [Candidatus Heimdallarchaeota archaeon]